MKNFRSKIILLAAFLLLSCTSSGPSQTQSTTQGGTSISSEEDVSSTQSSSETILSSAQSSEEVQPSLESETEETDISEDISSFQSSEPVTSVEKDEKGFPILPDSYLKEETSNYSFGAKVNEMPIYDSMRLFVGKQALPVYRVYVNNTHSWDPAASHRDENGVSEISISTATELTLQVPWAINGRVKISPLSKQINPTIDENYRTVRFTVSTPGDYAIEFRNNRVLHLFVYPYEASSQYNEHNCIYFGPGLHDKNNDSRLKSNSTLNLSSNQTVYLAEGAVVRGAFVANNSSNIKILGKGFVDGSTFDRNATTGTRLIPYDFNYCTNLTFDGIATLDPAGWTYNLYFCENLTLRDLKIISSRSNGDGISLQSCKHALVDGGFVRTYDDSIVVKNYPQWGNRAIEGTTEDIEVKNCLIWTDLAQCLEVGYETVGVKMEDIRFHDIEILRARHKSPLSIHNANNADIKNVSFENIVIEELRTGQGDGTPHLIDFTVAYSPTWSDQHKVTALGSTTGVKVKNIEVLQGISNPLINIKGSMEARSSYPKVAHYVKDVALENIVLLGQKIDQNYSDYSIEYASNITVDGAILA